MDDNNRARNDFDGDRNNRKTATYYEPKWDMGRKKLESRSSVLAIGQIGLIRSVFVIGIS
jgi:hypothetical protein